MLNIYGSELPVELYLHICRSLGPPTPDTIKALVNLLAVNSYIRSIVAGLPTWKELYEARYTHDVSEKEEDRCRQWGDDYCHLYLARRALDSRALRLVDEIRTQITGRSKRALILAKELSFDVWDALDEEVNLLPPKYFRDTIGADPDDPPSPYNDAPSEPHALSRSYWAKAVQGVIARYWAVSTWRRTTQGDYKVKEEEIVAAWSAFFGWSPQQIGLEIDSIASACRDGTLAPPSSGRVVWNQADPDFDLPRACTAIVECMRTLEMLRDDFNPEETEHIINSYPHVILTTERDYSLTTFAKTWIFLAICRRLGLPAYAAVALGSDNPVCVVRAIPYEHGIFLLDFAVDPVPYPATDIPILKRLLDDGAGWIPPLPLRWFFIHSMKEAAQNFALYNEQDVVEWSDAPHEMRLLASHAAQCALATETHLISHAYINFPEHISDIVPLDGHAILLDALIMSAPGSKGLVDNEHAAAVKATVQQLEDPDKLVMRRSDYPGHDLGAVGKVIVPNQAPDADPAVIVGWKPSQEGGQQMMYKVATSRGIEYWPTSECKYVGLTPVDAQILCEDLFQLGQFVEDVSFKEVDADGNPMRFLLTAEMRMRYPEDDIPEASAASGQ